MQPYDRSYVLLVGWLIGVLLISQGAPSTQGQITDITSSSSGTYIQKSGNTIDIYMHPEFPSRSGPNVFHSFGRFDLGAGDIANFVRPVEATTVISRVTGGVPSNINGTIQALGWSNFYFINPSGVVFGPSATLNVSGSVYISTAHYLVFSDGKVSNTRSVGSREILSSAPVSSFGFLQGAALAPITISGNQLTVASTQTLSVIGGPITIDGAQLTAQNGKVQAAGIGGVTCCRAVFSQHVEVGYGGEPVVVNDRLGYGGEVSSQNLAMGNLTAGSITMSPGSSFAALDASPAGVVVTNPGPDSIQNPPGSQKIVQPNLVTILPAGSTGTVGLSSAVQYPRVLAIPQLTIAAPRLLADKCAGVKDGQFSSFAQVNRDSAPPQPGRYLSSPTILDDELLRAGRSSASDLSVAMGAPQLLHVAPESITFLARNDGCAR